MTRLRPLALLLAGLSGPHALAAEACPDLSGHYRVAEFGPVLGDALEALEARSAGFTGSEVRLQSGGSETLSIWWKSGSTGTLSVRPNRILTHGVDFTCQAGMLVLKREASSSRNTDSGWYEGKSTVRLAAARGAGLTLTTSFTGRQRTTIYSYDSARISLPKPFTSRTLTESIRWPDISEPAPPAAKVDSATKPPPEPQEVAKVRQMLSATLLGNVRLGGLTLSGNAVRATLRAPYSDDAARLEDRLREAGIAYEVKVAPIWSNNAWHMELLIRPERAEAGRASKPSAFRVQQEMDKMRHPMVDVTRVEIVDDAYVATLNILGGESIENIIARLRANTAMFAEITPLGESVRPDAPRVRVARLKLRVR